VNFFPRHFPRPARAFTLVELLTVIAVITILLALLFPLVGTARKSAATTQETSNLRQIGQGLFLYANDNNGVMPNNQLAIAGTALGTDQPDRWTFQEAVDRYLGNRWKKNPGSIYNYRGNPIWYSHFAEPPPGWTPYAAVGQTQPFAYGRNPNINNTRWLGRMNLIPNPARTVAMAEVNEVEGVNTGMKPTTAGNVMTAYRANRNGGALYLFCDGHVGFLEGDQSEPTLLAAGKPNIWRWW
jgi:prepilin-type N-terminal cleavage/methylation domain-containing protein/prepilin-type processing-associated H-X9-DG protein